MCGGAGAELREMLQRRAGLEDFLGGFGHLDLRLQSGNFQCQFGYLAVSSCRKPVLYCGVFVNLQGIPDERGDRGRHRGER